MQFSCPILAAMFRSLLFFCCATTALADNDWPQWRGADRDDLSTESGLLRSWPEGGPQRLWMFEDCGIGYSGPAIVEGRLYLMGGRDGQAELICLDVGIGSELWHTRLGNYFENGWGDGPRSTPTVDGQLIYAMTATGNLVCLDREKGDIRWSVSMSELGGETPTWGYAESPLVFQNMVLCTPGGPQGTIAALDKRTGRVLWRTKDITDGAHYSSIVLMKVGKRLTGVQFLEKQLVGFDMRSGALLWSEPWPGRVAVIPTPIVRGDEVYVSAGYGSGCMKLRVNHDFTLEKLYENKYMTNHHGGVILLNGHLFGHSDRKGWTCQNFESGDRVWGDKKSLGKGAIAYADDHFYCLSETAGEVVLIHASTEGWQERGRFTLEPQTELRKPKGRIWVHPVIAGGRLYLRDQDLVYCYDVADKKLASQIPTSATE